MDDFLRDLPGYNLRRASNCVLSELSDGLSDLEMRPTEASMLITIEANPQITPSEVGKTLGIQRANMVPMVTRLEKRGAIFRTKLDGRSFGLGLTPEGTELCDRARTILTKFERQLLMRVPIKHRDHLLPALRALWE